MIDDERMLLFSFSALTLEGTQPEKICATYSQKFSLQNEWWQLAKDGG